MGNHAHGAATGGGARSPAAGGPCAPGAPHLLRADPIRSKPTRSDPTRSDPIRFSPARSSPAEGRRPARPRQRAGPRQREVAEGAPQPSGRCRCPPPTFCPHQRWAAAEGGDVVPKPGRRTQPMGQRAEWLLFSAPLLSRGGFCLCPPHAPELLAGWLGSSPRSALPQGEEGIRESSWRGCRGRRVLD